MAGQNRKTLVDHLRKAFGAKDEAEREEHLTAAEAALPGDDGDHDGDGHHITLNINGAPNGAADEPAKPKDGEGDPGEGTEMDEDKVKEICATAVKEALEPVTTAMQAITEKIEAMSTKVDETGEKADAVAEAIEDMSDPDDMGMQDAIARAEILAPGLTLPARDAKPGSKAHTDAKVSFKREALKRAMTTDVGRAVLGSLGLTAPHQVAALPPVALDMAFRSASQQVLDHNSTVTATTLVSATAGTFRDAEGKVKPLDNRTWNDINAKFFGRKA